VTTTPHPVRTCVGCRTTDAQGALLRVVVADGRVVADPARRAPGRGAYLHPRETCLAGAAKGGLARTLRHPVSRADLAAIAEIARGWAGFREGPSQRRADAVESVPPLSSASTPTISTDPVSPPPSASGTGPSS